MIYYVLEASSNSFGVVVRCWSVLEAVIRDIIIRHDDCMICKKIYINTVGKTKYFIAN